MLREKYYLPERPENVNRQDGQLNTGKKAGYLLGCYEALGPKAYWNLHQFHQPVMRNWYFITVLWTLSLSLSPFAEVVSLQKQEMTLFLVHDGIWVPCYLQHPT